MDDLVDLCRHETAALRPEFDEANPFRHVIVDDVLQAKILADVLDEFPPIAGMEIQHRDRTSVKAASSNPRNWGPTTRELVAQLNGSITLRWLEDVTGISGLIPDPHYVGGGLHQIGRGGRLGIHADFNIHEHLRLERRLNVLLYLNVDWQERWGGNLELWDQNMTEAVKSIPPVAGRMVLFETTDRSFHGHPEPLRCPSDRTRKSIALYYYTAPDQPTEPHGTLYQRRPGSRDSKSTHNMGDRLRRRVRRVTTGIHRSP